MTLHKKFKKHKNLRIKITRWCYEDELDEKILYDTVFPLSRTDFVRMFPCKINIDNSFPRKKVYQLVKQAYLDGKYGKQEHSIDIWVKKIREIFLSVDDK